MEGGSFLAPPFFLLELKPFACVFVSERYIYLQL